MSVTEATVSSMLFRIAVTMQPVARADDLADVLEQAPLRRPA